jgi:hypothetical protein
MTTVRPFPAVELPSPHDYPSEAATKEPDPVGTARHGDGYGLHKSLFSYQKGLAVHLRQRRPVQQVVTLLSFPTFGAR